MKVVTTIVLYLFLTGCASMFNGQQQLVTVKAPKDAKIYINDRYAGKGYSKRNLARDEIHTLRIELTNCQLDLTTQSQFNKTSLLGLMVDLGLVSIPVDFLSGAAWKITPSEFRVTDQCQLLTESY